MARQKPPTTQSPDFVRRPGADPFGGAGWRLVNTEDDPGSLAPNELQWAENVRLRGKIITTRPGMDQKINLTGHTNRSGGAGAVTWLSESPGNALHTRIWCATLGCLNAVDTGYQLYKIDPVESPAFQRYIDYRATTDRFSPIGRYGDRFLIGDGSIIKELKIITPPVGVSISTILGSNAGARPVFELQQYDGYTITFIKDFAGAVYVGLENTASPADSKIVRWDGTQWTDDLTGIRPPLAAGYWRNKLVVGFDATAAHIRVREPASSPSWTTVALAGFVCSVNQNSIQEYRDKTHIASGEDRIYSFDGSTLSLEHTIAGCDATGDGVTALCLHDNLLHYGWNASGAGLESRIGRHDVESPSTEWVDDYLDITAQQASFWGLTSMASYRRQIYVGGRRATFLATKANDVKGTMQLLNTGTASGGFRARQLMVFP